MYIVVDIGGTKTRVAGSADLEAFGEPMIFDTPQKYDEGIAAIVEAARTCSMGSSVELISIGAPGVIAPDHRSLATKGNIPDWKDKPLAAEIESALGGKAYMENDTALCGLGEALYGAGKGVDTIMYMTVSTGVGGVRIVHGHIDSPERRAEIGYQYLSIGDPLQRFSDLVSGKAIQKRFGVHPKELGKDHAVWEELARHTAIGVHNSILHWSPDRVVLGGSMFNEIGIPVERVKFHLQGIMRAFRAIPEIVHSQLGDVGGLWGGMARLKQLK